MNIVFWILVILVGVFLWAVLSFLFPLIGSFFKNFCDDVMYNITIKDNKEGDKE